MLLMSIVIPPIKRIRSNVPWKSHPISRASSHDINILRNHSKTFWWNEESGAKGILARMDIKSSAAAVHCSMCYSRAAFHAKILQKWDRFVVKWSWTVYQKQKSIATSYVKPGRDALRKKALLRDIESKGGYPVGRSPKEPSEFYGIWGRWSQVGAAHVTSLMPLQSKASICSWRFSKESLPHDKASPSFACLREWRTIWLKIKGK